MRQREGKKSRCAALAVVVVAGHFPLIQRIGRTNQVTVCGIGRGGRGRAFSFHATHRAHKSSQGVRHWPWWSWLSQWQGMFLSCNP